MKEKEIKQLEILHKKYLSALSKHEIALGILMNKLQDVVGKEMQYSEFPGDGLGVVVGDSSIHNYMSFWDAISIIRDKGTLNENEFTYM